jgi:hypothetical protein
MTRDFNSAVRWNRSGLILLAISPILGWPVGGFTTVVGLAHAAVGFLILNSLDWSEDNE